MVLTERFASAVAPPPLKRANASKRKPRQGGELTNLTCQGKGPACESEQRATEAISLGRLGPGLRMHGLCVDVRKGLETGHRTEPTKCR